MTGRTISRHFRLPNVLAALLCLALGAGHATPARAQTASSTVSVGTSAQLFATMCALDAAGFDANSSTLDIYPADAALRARLIQMKGPAVDALRQFYARHEFTSADETLSPYISFALVVGPPPRFRFLVTHDELPPAVLTIEGFDQILQDFYAEAQLDREWSSVQAETDREVVRLTGPVRQIVAKSTGYLREMLQPTSVRTFTVLVEPLTGDRVNFRNVGDHYFIIVGPGPVLPLGDIRHAFLHFLLDPLTLRYQSTVSTRNTLLSVAARAPQLPPAYQTDFIGLFDECLVRAVELRIRKLPSDQLARALIENDRTGYILVRPIYLQLVQYENAEPSMSFYFPRLVEGINVGAELRRLQNFQFASASEKIAPGGMRGEEASTVHEAELNQALVRGDRQIAMKDAAGAAATFQSILNQHPDLPRAMYGLAIASILQGQGEKAENLFEQLVSRAASSSNATPAPSLDIVAWSHVYLGRIRDLQGDRDSAMNEYRAALSVNGAPEAARVAAQQGIDAPYHPAPKGQQ